MDDNAPEKLLKRIDQLKEERKFYKSIADYTYDWEYLVDINGNILYVSPSCERITGFTPADFIEDTKLLEKIVHKENKFDISRHFEEELKSDKSYSFEFRIISKNGKEKWIEHKCQSVYDEQHNLIGRRASNRDITEGKYRLLYALMNEGMALHQIVYDDKGNPSDYLILDVNPAFEKITGLKKDNIVEKKATEVYRSTKAPYLDIYYKVAINGDPTRFEVDYEPMGKSFSISVFSPEKNKFATVFDDITERKKAEKSLKKIEWLLTKSSNIEITKKKDAQPYGNLLELNTNRLILDSVGEETLSYIVGDYLDILETSSAIYEKNGDYAYGIFSSGWCKQLDRASRELCNTKDNKEALSSGKWHCHESCWVKSSKVAIETGKPSDIECPGGIHLYAVPIFAKKQIIGSINFGYGDPPKDPIKLKEISKLYNLNIEELSKEADKYETRPKFIIDIAKKRVHTSAKLIGEIVERKITEDELVKNERTLRVLFDSAPIGICLLKDQRFQWINRKMAEILGYSPEELVGQNTRILYDTEEEYDRVGKILYPSGNNANSMGVESILKRKDGTLINCSTSISALDPSDYSKGFIKTLMDITDKKKLEQQIIKLAKFPSENPNPILRVSLDGELLYANNSTSELLSFWKINTGNKLPNEIINLIDEVLLFKKQLQKDIIVHDKIFSLTFVPFPNELYINIYGKDITEERKAEAEILKYQNQLEDLVAERTARLEIINKELEAFSYSVSHDLRAPLRAIDGFGQALVEEYGNELGEEGKHYLKRIRNATIKMGNLIDDILKLSRISRSTMKYEKINLSLMTGEILSELKKSDPKRKVKITIAKDAIVNGDAGLLRIMLENLLNNAWKFTSKEENAIIEFGVMIKEGKNIYFIKDNGVGFDMEYADKLFTPFHRLHSDEEFTGTGVGLANVNRIINMHGGKIWAEGKVGEGATFYFTI